MARHLIILISSLIGAVIGVGVVVETNKATRLSQDFGALALIPGLIYGFPVGLILGGLVGAMLTTRRRPPNP